MERLIPGGVYSQCPKQQSGVFQGEDETLAAPSPACVYGGGVTLVSTLETHVRTP